MKHLKATLMATVMSLTLSLLMLTSASFAWFTISTAPEISTLDTTVVTNDNLEIALAKVTGSGATLAANLPAAAAVGDSASASKAYTWGNLIDLSGATGGNYGSFSSNAAGNTKLRPVGLGTVTSGTYAAGGTGASFWYPSYGADGRVDELAALNTETPFLNESAGTGFGTLEASGKPYAYYVDFWVRSNVGGDLVLASPVDHLKLGDSNSTSGDGTVFTATTGDATAKTVLEQNLRIAFRVLGTGTVDGAAATMLESAATDVGKATPAARNAIAAVTTGPEADRHPAYNSFTAKVIDNMSANTAYLVRMFVYLEGAEVNNAAASTTATQIAGQLKVQFKLVDDSGNLKINNAGAMQVNPGV